VDKNKIKNYLDSLVSKKILVIGDVMVDAYMWGKVERISPEAPVPIVTCSRHESRLGGAANVALNIQSMGATPILCGIVGNDDNGTFFLKLMQQYHLQNIGIHIVKGRQTTVKTRIIGGNQLLVRIDEETTKPLDGKNEQHFLEHLQKVISGDGFDAIIFQDYDKGSITPSIIAEIITIAKQKNIPVLVDPKKRNFLQYSGSTLFKPNFKEFCEGLKIELVKDDLESIFEHAKMFQKTHNIELLMITLSEKGVFISNGAEYFHLPAHIRDISDVSGAGDTVISVASLCLSSGLSPKETAAISNLAGGLVCEKAGVVPIDKVQLETELKSVSY
jgi:D-glycero-beta-D-manno-heptose-7-phosphate kinase